MHYGVENTLIIEMIRLTESSWPRTW